MQTSCTRLYTPYHTYKSSTELPIPCINMIYHISTVYRHNSFLGKSVYLQIRPIHFPRDPAAHKVPCKIRQGLAPSKRHATSDTSFQNAVDFTVSACWPFTIHHNAQHQRNGAYHYLYAYFWSKPWTWTASFAKRNASGGKSRPSSGLWHPIQLRWKHQFGKSNAISHFTLT